MVKGLAGTGPMWAIEKGGKGLGLNFFKNEI